jgi:predicted DNA binding CopG/RHH family protein
MRKEYDFSKGSSNPYAKKLKRSVTIRLETETIRYFKRLANDTGMPYQTLINLYLRDCAASRRRLRLKWVPKAASGDSTKKAPRP